MGRIYGTMTAMVETCMGNCDMNDGVQMPRAVLWDHGGHYFLSSYTYIL